MKSRILPRSFFAICLLLYFGADCVSFAQPQKPVDKSARKASVYQPDHYQILNINNLTTWAREDGQSNHSPSGDNGTYFPRGTSFVIYQDGLIFGAKAYLDSAHAQPAPFGQTLRVGGATYGTGTREGWVAGAGATARAIDPDDPRARIYRIRRDWKTLWYDELRRDAAESNEINLASVTEEQWQAIYDEYAWSWENWPVHRGAPFIDRNGDGRYTPPQFYEAGDLIANSLDEPGISGMGGNTPADQVIWTVCNDLDRERAKGRFGSEPLGLEIQATIWGYKRFDPLGNVFFRKWRIINKGGVDIDESGANGSFWLDSLYIGQWADPDLGDFSDDVVGCDPARNLGFAYNANLIDKQFQQFNLPPPAIGYDILQGPVVPSPGDVAMVNNRPKPDSKNLGMTSFVMLLPGNPYEDPAPASYPRTAANWYKSLRGYIQNYPEKDTYLLHPPGVAPGPFPLSGDPVSGTGHIDGLGTNYSLPPGDRRMVLACGPFRMAPGDTQEVVVAFIAGLGADRLSSLTVLKFNDRFAQSAYDFGFQLPGPPLTPKLTYTALDGKILLKWGEDPRHVAQVEKDHASGFRFEGYNIYQLPSAHWNPDEAIKIATFDRKNGVMAILEQRFDPENGVINLIRIQVGTDSGLDYKLLVARNEINFGTLFNGKDYYFAITAYNYHPDKPFGIAALESAPAIVKATPHRLNPGARWTAAFGDTLPAIHTSGNSDGAVHAIVVDPSKMTGDTYKVTFGETAQQPVWRLQNATQGQMVFSEMANQSGDDAYLIADGVQVVVVNPPSGMKAEFDGFRSLTGQRMWTWTLSRDFDLEGFFGAIGWGGSYPYNASTVAGYAIYDVAIRYADTDPEGRVLDANDGNFSFGYRFLANASNPPAKSSFVPFIKNPAGHFSFQDFTKSVPWAAYAYDDKTGQTGKRLSIGFLENNNENGLVDGRWWPPVFSEASNTDETGPTEWFWIFDLEYSETPDTSLASPDATMLDGAPKPILLWGTVARRLTAGFGSENSLAIFVNKSNGPQDEFVFQTIAPTYDDDMAREDVLQQINAFPNPYYGPTYSETELPALAVTFSHLPQRAVIRIFNLAGSLVRVLQKDSASQFFKWDLLNSSGRYVASGLYIAHIDMPDLGVSKVLKLAVVQ